MAKVQGKNRRRPRKGIRQGKVKALTVPASFGARYIAWAIWSNAITLLMIVQAILATLTLDPTIMPHDEFHWLLVANAVLCAILAQIKRNTTPPKKR